MPAKLRAGVIGATGKGNYGHGLDAVFSKLDGVELIALADENEPGRAAAGKRLGVSRLYADYREMLKAERLNLVSVCPRWVDQRLAMVRAAAEAGCHVYCEKPLAGDLVAGDALLEACRKAGTQLAVAHQFRAVPPVRKLLADVQPGKFGKVLRMRARSKDDRRGGGEELIVLGTHLFDLMIAFAGPPRWVSAHVAVGARDAVLADARQGSEPVGPIAGDSISATFGFDKGVRGFYDSIANLPRAGGSPYGLLVECEQASLLIRGPGDVFIYPATTPVPEDDKLVWKKVWIEDWHFYPDHKPRPSNDWIHRCNQMLVTDLLASIQEKRPPLASGTVAHQALEMIQGVYASHFVGGQRVPLPLRERAHPLAGGK